MKRLFSLLPIILVTMVLMDLNASGSERMKLAPDTPDSTIISMHPKEIDPSLLPLDSIENLHTTGRPRQVDIEVWQLEVKGAKVKNPMSLSYQELSQMEMVEKKVILICPGVFVDYAEWEGVPLSAILEEAGIEADYGSIVFYGLDGYSSELSWEETQNSLLFLALKVNGETLPREHGFPVRLVAEDVLGGRWVKWISSIEVRP